MTYTPQLWQDEILAGEEEYTIKNSAGSVLYDDVKIELKTPVVQAGSDVSAERMNHIEQGIVNATSQSTSFDMLSTLTNSEISITGAATATVGRMHVCSGSSNYSIAVPSPVGLAGQFVGFRFTNTGITSLTGSIDGTASASNFVGTTRVMMSDGSTWTTISAVNANSVVTISPLAMYHSKAQGKSFVGSQVNGYWSYQLSPADGDYFEFYVFLTKGTKTIALTGETGVGRPKLSWSIDGSAISAGQSQDWYSATDVYSVTKTFSVSVPFTGTHLIRATVSGRNASSTAWYYAVSEVDIYPS